MKDKKQIISENISLLRKRKKWTQVELAEKINFTDKAVSKWERNESTPDVDTLYTLANTFDVTVDYLFHEPSEDRTQYELPDKRTRLRDILILILLCIAVIFIASVVFVLPIFKEPDSARYMWISFIWANPVCSFIATYYFKKTRLNMPILFTVFFSLTMWTFLASVYLQAVLIGFQIPLVFIIGIPIQSAIIVMHFMRK